MNIRCRYCNKLADYIWIEDYEIIPLCKEHMDTVREQFGELNITFYEIPFVSMFFENFIYEINEMFKTLKTKYQRLLEECKKPKVIHNPVTGKDYPIHRRETSEETRKRIKNLWKRRDRG